MIANQPGNATRTLTLDPVTAPNQPKRSLVTHLLDPTRGFRLLWTAAIGIPLAVVLVASHLTWKNVEQQTRARIARTVDMLHEHALRSFETQEAVLEAIDQRVRDMSWPEIAGSRQVHQFVTALASRTAPSGGIGLISPDKRIVNGSGAFPARSIDASDRDYLRDHPHDDQRAHVGEVVLSRPFGTTVFSLSRMRHAGDAEHDGWIATSFKPGYFSEFYGAIADAQGDALALLRDNGSILARSPPLEEADLRKPTTDSALPRLVASSPVAGMATVRSRIDGVERLVAYRRVGGYPVYVTYGVTTAGMRAAWMRAIGGYASISLVAAALLAGLTARVQLATRREQSALAAARAEAERRADAESRLRHSQRIDALGQIVGGVAHDFTTLVQAMRAGAARAARRAEEPEEVRRVAGLIEAAAERGARLIGRMLAFARREEASTGSVDVAAALADVCELLSATLGSGYRVRFDRPAALPEASADRTEFETVVANLVINARDAMKAGGTVVVSADLLCVEPPAEGDPEGLAAGRYVRIEVTDTGEGMDEATLARAGEAFFTTKERGRGTGLGLAMARGFAEQAGGRLSIVSAPGVGTTVTLLLPVASPAA